LEDVERAKKTGAYGLIIGRALYEGLISLREAIRVGKDC
jgi:phosphoribosylformimino-5-aminoimidazole carboxamide ribonucleotide (ProFAR) isomerase